MISSYGSLGARSRQAASKGRESKGPTQRGILTTELGKCAGPLFRRAYGTMRPLRRVNGGTGGWKGRQKGGQAESSRGGQTAGRNREAGRGGQTDGNDRLGREPTRGK